MKSPERPAIVLAPYGSLSPRALATYESIRKAYEREFPGSAVRLAFTSQLMIKRLQEKEGITVASPLEALSELHSGVAGVWWSNPCRSCRVRSSTSWRRWCMASRARKPERDARLRAPGDRPAPPVEPGRLQTGLQSPASYVERLRPGRWRQRRRGAATEVA